MTLREEDLDKFNDLLDITVNTARDTEMTFTSMQSALAFAKKYDKGKLEKQLPGLQTQLQATFDQLCTSLDSVNKLNRDINELIEGHEKP